MVGAYGLFLAQLSCAGGLMGLRAMRVDAPGEALPAYLHDAVDFIITNLSESLSVDDVAAVAGRSTRGLQWAFQRHFGSGVMAFVLQRRLEQANQQLLDPDADSTNVTAVAMNNGFRHLSRFSSAYRKCFGEYPSETLQRRQSGGGPSIGGHQTITDAN